MGVAVASSAPFLYHISICGEHERSNTYGSSHLSTTFDVFHLSAFAYFTGKRYAPSLVRVPTAVPSEVAMVRGSARVCSQPYEKNGMPQRNPDLFDRAIGDAATRGASSATSRRRGNMVAVRAAGIRRPAVIYGARPESIKERDGRRLGREKQSSKPGDNE